jgi:uncharacterized protein YukE
MPELNIVELIIQTGALGALIVVLFLLARYGSQFIQRMLDHLDAGVKAQADVAANMKILCDHIDDCESTIQDQGAATAKVMVDLSKLLQAHEGRAQKRHEQATAHADQRHAELVGVLKGLNGKT